jgi:osmotically inducible protein OsmC
MAIRIVRSALASWEGTTEEGGGRIALGSGAFEGPYTLRSRVEEDPATNPEELIGAGHAGCYTMSLASLLGDAGHPARTLETRARVQLEPVDGGRWAITRVALETEGDVPGVDQETFARLAEQAKSTCPVSRALAGTEITLEARLREGG